MAFVKNLLAAADQKRADETRATLEWLFKHGDPQKGVELPVHSTLDGTLVTFVAARYSGAVDVDGSLDGEGSYRFSFEAEECGIVLHIKKEA